MRFSYLFKQSIYRLLLLILIDAIFFIIAIYNINRLLTQNFHNPLPSIILGLILFPLTGIIFRELDALGKGIDGESKVRRILKKLPDGYYHLSDFSNSQKGNIDLVVVGPTGIWTIEVKNLKSGEITYTNEILCRDGLPFEKDMLKQAYAESKHLAEYIHQSLGLLLPVNPVLVFANKYTKVRFGKNPVNGVYVIGTSWLEKLILERQITLTLEQCIRVRAEIKKYTSII